MLNRIRTASARFLAPGRKGISSDSWCLDGHNGFIGKGKSREFANETV